MVARVIFLGTPHHGSVWEQLGHAVSTTIQKVPRPYMKLASEVANLRSAGIQDLRYGYILDEDWMEEQEGDGGGGGGDALWWWESKNNKHQAYLPDWISFYVITGTVTSNPNHFMSRCIGDALVRKDSAHGRVLHCDSDEQSEHLPLPYDACTEFSGVKHWQLSNHPRVYQQIKEWMEQPRNNSPLSSASTDDGHSSDEYKNDDEFYCDGDCRGRRRGSKWSQRKGAAALVQDVVGNGVKAVEGVHRALTDEIFDVAAKVVAPASPLIRSIQTIHDTSVFWVVYGSIWTISRGTTEIAKYACVQMDKEGAE